MLQSAWARTDGADLGDTARDQGFDFDGLIAAARRQYPVVLLFAMIALIAGAAYAFTAVPLYTASTDLLIDQNRARLVDQLSAVSGVTDDDTSVLTQVEVLKSDHIGLAVVDRLDLTQDPTFIRGAISPFEAATGFFRRLFDPASWFASPELAGIQSQDLRYQALGILRGNLRVDRVGRTYVLRVSYTWPDRGEAARIADAFTQAYLDDLISSKYDATRRTGQWLSQRIAELRDQSMSSDLAVQKFRAQNNLITTGGQLFTEQQLGEINSQLTVAAGDTAHAKATYERIQAIIDSGDVNAAVDDSIKNTIISGLRAKYLEDAKLEASVAQKLGTDHPRAQLLRAEMAQYQKQIFDELKRIAEGGRNAYEVAQAREKAMRQNLGSSLSVNADANETQVKLRELEREADTYKSLYQTYLGRYQDAQQQQSFPITEARVISSAVPPGSASYPNKGRVLALFFLFGAGAGAGLGAFREYRDRFFRLGEQVREYLGLEFLGMLPQLPPEPDLFGWPASQGFICCSDGLARHVVKHPLSTFAESLRSAKIAADLAGGSQTATVIGLVSALPGEGKSTVAANFAQLLAMQGSRTLLIDGDLRNPELSRMYGRHARRGLVEVVSDGLALEPALLKDSETGLAFLPSVLKRRVANAGAILASTGMQGLLKSAGTAFDYIVIDLPPLAPVVDVRGFAGHVHAFLMVVEWGRTARKVVASTLQSEIQIAEKCAGVLLNKADVEKLKLYRSYGSSEYYMSRFSGYYHDDAGQGRQ